MAQITREELMRLMNTSQIALDEDEIPSVIEKMNAVLEYAERVQQLASQAQAQQQLPALKNVNVMRDDVSLVCDPEEVLKCAPEVEGNFFVVPKIIKQS